jgi:hypothetical protein
LSIWHEQFTGFFSQGVHLHAPHFSADLQKVLRHSEVQVCEWGCDDFRAVWRTCPQLATLQLFMVDKWPEEVTHIAILFFPLTMEKKIFPHVATMGYQIQNTCGIWTFSYQVDLSKTARPVLRNQCVGYGYTEVLYGIAGSYVVCTNKRQICFRGVRSFKHMIEDWKVLSGIRSEYCAYVSNDTELPVCTCYMLLLNAYLGFPVDVIAGQNYLVNNVAGWAQGTLHVENVCNVVQLTHIFWKKCFAMAGVEVEPSALTQKCKCIINISRLGGSVMHLMFPPQTRWNQDAEDAVVHDCNVLYGVLWNILRGALTTH